MTTSMECHSIYNPEQGVLGLVCVLLHWCNSLVLQLGCNYVLVREAGDLIVVSLLP
jgi:hypothetical protein